MPAKIPDNLLRPIIEEAQLNNYTAQQVCDILWTQHQVKACVRTICRRLKEWNLTERKVYNRETLHNAVLQKSQDSLSQKRALISLKNEDNIIISQRTLTRCESELNLHCRLDDLDLGRVDFPQLIELINEMQH